MAVRSIARTFHACTVLQLACQLPLLNRWQYMSTGRSLCSKPPAGTVSLHRKNRANSRGEWLMPTASYSIRNGDGKRYTRMRCIRCIVMVREATVCQLLPPTASQRGNVQEIWANAQETRDSISLISYAGCLGLSPVYFSENSLYVCVAA